MARILEWHKEFVDVEGHARVVTLEEIAKNECNLNISRYIEPRTEEENISVDEALSNLKASLENAYAAEDHLQQLLANVGLL